MLSPGRRLGHLLAEPQVLEASGSGRRRFLGRGRAGTSARAKTGRRGACSHDRMVGGEHGVGAVGPGPDRRRAIDDEHPRMRAELDTVATQHRLHAPVAGPGERSGVEAEVHRAGLELPSQYRELSLRRPDADHEPAATLAQGPVEVSQRLEHELSPGGRLVAALQQAIIQTEDRDHGVSRFRARHAARGDREPVGRGAARGGPSSARELRSALDQAPHRGMAKRRTPGRGPGARRAAWASAPSGPSGTWYRTRSRTRVPVGVFDANSWVWCHRR